jgi:transcriptional regulator with GAF, ATPase, and Fis domain/tetratricopeptide (TPR) repeat protein
MAIQLTVAGQRLEAEALVGSGATSVVWRCRRLDVGDYCALKVAKRAEDQAILADEADRLLWGMSPWLPRLLGIGRLSAPLSDTVLEQSACLILEWVDGVTLRALTTTSSIDEQCRLVIARDLARALADLHAAGLAHGDIKPENVIVCGVPRDGTPASSASIRAWLLDLGLAAGVDSAVPRGGTRRYLAPEIASPRAAGDGRTRDLWALGLLLAEMVDASWHEQPCDVMSTRALGLGALAPIVAPLLAMVPGARPPAAWVQLQAAARLNRPTSAEQVLETRRARIRRAYLNVRRQELVQVARARSAQVLVQGNAGRWIDELLPMLRALDALRGVKRREDAVEIADASPTSRLRFIVDLVGPIAASWPTSATANDGELIDRMLLATEHVEPAALTLRSLADPQLEHASIDAVSPVEMALELAQSLPRRPVLDAAEAYAATANVPLAFRLTLGRQLRLIGEVGRSLSVFDASADPIALAEAAETARRAGDAAGALSRIERIHADAHEFAISRAAATEARILLDSGAAAAAHDRLASAPESVALLEVRALAQIRLDQHQAAFETLERARSLASSDEEQARIAATLGMLSHATADAGTAVTMFQRAVEYAARAGALLEEATYLTGLAAAAVDSSRIDEAIAAAQRATALFEILNQPERAARAALNRVAALAAVGAVVSARAAAQVALGFARAVKDDRCAANVHLALVDAGEGESESAEHLRRAMDLLSDPTTDEQLLLLSREQDLGWEVDTAAGDALALRSGVGPVPALDWWGARARQLHVQRDFRTAPRVVGELTRLLSARVSAHARGRAFAAGVQLARAAQMGDAARRLYQAALEDLKLLSQGCSAELRTALLARVWVKSLRAPESSLVSAEQVPDVETLVRALGRWEELRPLLVQVLDALVLWTGVERGLMLLCAPGGRLQARVGRNIGRSDLVGHQLDLSHTLATRALEQQEPIVAIDASGELDSVHASVHALKLRSVLAVPLIARGEALGVVYLDDRIRRGAFGERELAWVRLLGAVAAVAIADARDRLRLRRAARRAQRAEQRMAEMLAVKEAELGQARIELARTRDDVQTRYRYADIIGNSHAMQQLLKLVDRVVAADVPVLIVGGSGTGKERVARAIHQNGPRSHSAFVAENCGAIPEPLLESALFGHVKGAFTGAARTRAGLFEVAHEGTLFLDEVAEMSLGMQTKLLRVLEEGEFWPVGSERSKRADVRIIAATHRDLEAMVSSGSFRQDLYYRLNVVCLRVPDLKDRHGDIPLLVQYFLDRYAAGRAISIEPQALEFLCRYAWPGNVRQLENEIRRAIVLSDERITTEQLSDELRKAAMAARPVPIGLELRPHLDALERELVSKALERTAGNQTRAAELLGVSRFGLQKMMRRLDIRGTELPSRVVAMPSSTPLAKVPKRPGKTERF